MAENSYHYPTKLMKEQREALKLKERVVGTAAFALICTAIYSIATSPVGQEVWRILTTVPDR